MNVAQAMRKSLLNGAVFCSALAITPAFSAPTEKASPDNTTAEITENRYLHKNPPAEADGNNHLKNIARMHMGAMVEVLSSPKPVNLKPLSSDSLDPQDPRVLLTDDASLLCLIPAGHTSLMITLAGPAPVNHAVFFQKGGQGTVRLCTSSMPLADQSTRWREVVAESPLKLDENLLPLSVTAAAKYYRLEFNLSQPAEVHSLGLFSNLPAVAFMQKRASINPVAEERKDPQPRMDIVNYNYANIYNSGRVAYVSSGGSPNQANFMVDDNSSTAYSFAADDPEPVTVIDLGQQREARRASVLYSGPPGSLDFYFLNGLPGQDVDADKVHSLARAQHEDWKLQPLLAAVGNAATPPAQTSPALDQAATANTQVRQFPKSFFQQNQSFRTVDIKPGDTNCAFDFSLQQVRYVLLRFRPAHPGDASFNIVEVCVFGNTKLDPRNPFARDMMSDILGVDAPMLPFDFPEPQEPLNPPPSVNPPPVPVVSP